MESLTPTATDVQPTPPPTTTAARATTPPKTGTTTRSQPTTEDVHYANCDAVRAAGKAPLHRGDPGYRSGLDRDSDGLACE